MQITIQTLGVSCLFLMGTAVAGRLSDRLFAEHTGFLDERREALPSLSDPYGVPAVARVVQEQSRDSVRGGFHWKSNVVGTVFWVGEAPTSNNPTPNDKSAWDQNWLANFGGYDNPNRRSGWRPEGFIPQLNPFYVALPYNDVAPGGVHRSEASEVIPWFWESYRGDGISVCKGRWVGVHYKGRVCYAQWEDVGPFEVDHWQYVFGNEQPRPNRNGAAGIDFSPAVRDYLGYRSGERVQWRFLNDRQVPKGPWRDWTTDLPADHPPPSLP